MQEFVFTVEHIPGKENVFANALLRFIKLIQLTSIKKVEPKKMNVDKIRKLY